MRSDDYKKSILRSIIFEKQPVVKDSTEGTRGDVLTINNLSSFEKEFILNEFCEILTEDEALAFDIKHDFELYKLPSQPIQDKSFDLNNNSKNTHSIKDQQSEDIYWKPCITIN